MTVLLLRLAGPMQSWGDSSRFTMRDTRQQPTKSGVLGLLAAAQGRRRTDPVEDLASLRFGVRTDQEGRRMRDFHTAAGAPLSDRFYIVDGTFLAAVEGDQSLLEALDEALLRPQFALYLGRRSCPTVGRVSLGLTDQDLETALREHPWLAADWYRRRQPKSVRLSITVDAVPGSVGDHERRPDVPVSFNQERRLYGWRSVHRLAPVELENPLGHDDLDFFAAVGGA